MVHIESGAHAGAPGEDVFAEAVELEVTEQGSARVVRVAGEIDTVTAPSLRSALLAAVRTASLVVVDLSEVDFLGSSGLAVLVEARELAQHDRHELRLVCGARIVVRALEATGLRTLFDIAPDVPTALRDPTDLQA